MILVILASSLLNLSAAPAADIPSKMLDNIYLDALTYTGYKTDVQKADGSIFKTYSGNAPESVRSGIGYGTGPSGLETVAADNKTGKAPDIARFKANGLCCASYVSYVYYNYLPNIARMDVSKIPQPANPRSPISYNSAVENWVGREEPKESHLHKAQTALPRQRRSQSAPLLFSSIKLREK